MAPIGALAGRPRAASLPIMRPLRSSDSTTPPGQPRPGLSRRTLLGLAAALAVRPAGRLLASSTAALAPAPALRAQRLAWAGVRLISPQTELYLDPLLDPSVWGPALSDSLALPDDGLADRFVLVTHLHPDHFDPTAARHVLGANGTLICDASVAADSASRGFKVRAARLFEPMLLGDFTATAVPAVDGYGAPQVSWVADGAGRRVIHCGDTLWHGLWWQIGRQFGPFDAAFLPINGARFRWRQPAAEVPSVMTAEQAVAAALVLGARLLVPIHYGVHGAEGYQEGDDVAASARRIGAERQIDVQVLAAGDWVRWPEDKKAGS